MEKTIYNDAISARTVEAIHAAGDKLSVKEGLKFIATDLKIAPSCVESILTSLGYIYHIAGHIAFTPRLGSILFYDNNNIDRPMFTINGLELLYRLVFNSTSRDKTQRIIHPAIFDGYAQNLAKLDEKNLVYLNIALDEIWTTLNNRYHTIMDKYKFNTMLENINMFKFKANGVILKCMGNFNFYTYYVYNLEDIDEDGVANALSINSTEIYISKDTYDKLFRIIDEEFARVVKAESSTNIEESKTNKNEFQEIKKMDKFINLNLFISMITDCYEKCNKSDVIEALVRLKLIKMGDNNKIYVNEANKFLYVNIDGDILVKTEKLFALFFKVISDYKLRCIITGQDPDMTDIYMAYNNIFNGPKCGCMEDPTNSMTSFRPEKVCLNSCPLYACHAHRNTSGDK